MDLMTLSAKINLDSSNFDSGLKKSESKLKEAGDKISAWAVAKGQVIAGLMQKAGQTTLNFVKDSVNERREFDKSMAQVAATLGKSTKEVQDLSKFARKMGAETAFSANEAAQALNYMALAGYDSETSMRMLPTVLNLAAAGNMDLAKASDMVTDAQSALGLSVEQTETLVDQMAKTSSKTNTSVEQLGEAMLTVGGTAKNLKGGTKELSALLGVLADNGIKGSEGGTALRNVMLSLTAPTDKAAKTLKKFKIDAFDSKGNMKDFPTILEDINKATSKMSEAERTNFLSTVFNKRDLKSIEALLGTSKDRWAELFEEIGNSGGAASKMAGTQLDNLEGDLTIFKSALSEARLSLVEKLTPALRKFTQFGTKSIQRLTNAFNKRGFSGALQVAGNIFDSFISTLRGSGNTVVRGFGKALRRVSDGFKAVKLIFKDFPAGMKKLKGVASDVFKDIKEGVKNGKIKIADMVGIEDPENATWGDIGSQIITNIKAKLTESKIKLAEYFDIEDAENASWGDIATKAFGKIKEKFKEASKAANISLANWLGLTDKNGNALETGDTSWEEIGSAIFGKIQSGFKRFAAASEIKLANWLGLTDASGNPVDDADDTTWGDIASGIVGKIREGFKDLRIKVAELLNVDDPEEATWKDVGDKIKTRLSTGLEKAKTKLAELLDVDDPEEATWTDIGSKLKERITNGVGKSKVKLAELLGLSAESVEGEDGWEAIGRAVVSKLTEHLSHKGDFLKKLILGDEFDPEKSTWLDVGTKIAGWIEESFGEGGFLNALLTSGLDKLTGLAPVIGQLMSGFADWIKNNSSQIVEIVTSIAHALAEASGPIIEALAKILSDETLWQGLGDALETVLLTVLEALGFYKPETFTPKEAPKPKKGERKLHGEGLNQDQLYSLYEMRDIWKNNPEALFDFNGEKIDAGAMFETIFKQMLETNSFDKEDIDTLWGEAQTEDDSEFTKTMTDLANASQANVKPMQDVGTASTTASEVLDSMSTAAGNAATELNNVKAPSWGGGENDDGKPHAKGLYTVPYDDYLARLHRDEMVLSASQARDYRAGNQNVDFAGLEDKIISAIRAGMAGATVQAVVSGGGITNMVNTITSNELKGRRFAP